MENWDSDDGFGWLLLGLHILAVIALIQLLYGLKFTIATFRNRFQSGGIIVYWLVSFVSIVAFIQYGNWLIGLLTYLISSPLLAIWLWYCSRLTRQETITMHHNGSK